MLGFRMIYGRRDPPTSPFSPEDHTIAIAYKPEEWVLIDTELIDFGDLIKWFPSMPEMARNKKGMLCLMQH